jgi:hypothetical protein
MIYFLGSLPIHFEWLAPDVPVAILGPIDAQASDLHFDRHLPGGAATVTVPVTVFDLVEYGRLLPGGGGLDKGVFPRTAQPAMGVRFVAHEKHESLNTSSRFGWGGMWEWEHFPYTRASTGVGHFRVESDRVYDLFYVHNHTSGNHAAPLADLILGIEGDSSITFSDAAHKVLRIRPLYSSKVRNSSRV